MSTTSTPWVLGLSASHNGAACLLHGDRIVAAVQEERLVGKKRARLQGARPSLAVRYCLDQGGIVAAETNSIYFATGTTLKALEKHMVDQGRWLNPPPVGASMPGFGSLGGFFSAAAEQIFGDSMEAGKVMGLAPYGSPTIDPGEFFEIRDGRFVFFDDVPKRFTTKERWPNARRQYEDLACSVQNALEHALLYLVGRVRELCPSRNLVYAGGVALNSIANERIIRETDFDRVYFMPAAEDSGPAIGAAYHGLWHLTGAYSPQAPERDGFGRTYDTGEISAAIDQTPSVVTHETCDAVSVAADLLVDGKIIAWFTGPSELGPRALGQRSILCDPRQSDAKEKLNARVKHREAFRPFAPVILLEEVENWFDVDGVDPSSPFMLRVMSFREGKRDLVPAVVHVDGTGRVQTVTRAVNGSYYDLVKEFAERTGVPILLNTSLNVMGEPIVETPEDALWCLLLTQLDACVFDGAVVTKKPGYRSLADMYPYFLVESKDIRRPSSGDGVLFAVTTPWGPHVFGLRDETTIAILDLLMGGAMDGGTKADEVFDRIHRKLGPTPESFLIRLFAQLRRWRVISFRETPTQTQSGLKVSDTSTELAASARSEQIDTLERASRSGDSRAAARLELRYLMAKDAPADPARGMALIEQAALAGDPQGACLAATIASSSFWRTRNWDEAFEHLMRAAQQGHEPSQGSLRILAGGPSGNLIEGEDWANMRGEIDLAAWLEPPESRMIRESPRMHVIEKFAPPAACNWLIAQAEGRLSRATIYDKATGGTTEDGRRTNSQCDLDIERCGVLTFVLRGRIAAITGRQDLAMEIPKILHYAPGDTFAEHFDYLDPAEPEYATEIAVRGQRTDTFLIYLNDDYSGGETFFPRIGLSHIGAKGDALLFRNVDAAGAPDGDTMHAGLPPTSGEKWVFSQWIREFPKE